MNELTPPESADSMRPQEPANRKRILSQVLIGLICAVPVLYIIIQGWSAHQRSKQLDRQAQEASQKLQELRKNSPPVDTPQTDEALYDMIEQTGSASLMAVRLNYEGAIKRDLTCSRILSNRMAYFGVPVAFAGKIKRTIQDESNGRKMTSAAMEVIESDSTCANMVIIALCPTRPTIKDGEPGIIIGYMAMNLESDEINPRFVFVAARTILSHEQAARYKLFERH